MGRNKKPNKLKELVGEDRPSRISQEIPMVQLMTPEDLKATMSRKIAGLPTVRSKKIFAKKCETLIAMGMMEEAYLEQMALYARWLDMAFTASERLNKQLTETEWDKEFKTFSKATERVNEIARQFGFTPVSRSNIPLQEKAIDPAEALMEMMNNG